MQLVLIVCHGYSSTVGLYGRRRRSKTCVFGKEASAERELYQHRLDWQFVLYKDLCKDLYGSAVRRIQVNGGVWAEIASGDGGIRLIFVTAHYNTFTSWPVLGASHHNNPL